MNDIPVHCGREGKICHFSLASIAHPCGLKGSLSEPIPQVVKQMVDVEKGISPGVYTTAPHFPSLISPTYLEHGQLDQSPSQEGSHFCDTSAPLFTMHSTITHNHLTTMPKR